MRYVRVHPAEFTRALSRSWDRELGNGQTLGAQLSPDAQETWRHESSRCYLSADGLSGYVIVPIDPRHHYGDLQTVWSAEAGRGAELVASAIGNGAETLDCFDGYLPTFYARHGFEETHRQENWTPGGPDVVYMTYTLAR